MPQQEQQREQQPTPEQFATPYIHLAVGLNRPFLTAVISSTVLSVQEKVDAIMECLAEYKG